MLKKLDENSAINFAKMHFTAFKNSDNIKCTELSDGNINYVFRAEDIKTHESVIIKQAAKSFRTSPDDPLTDERILFEIGSLKKINELCPGFAPEIYAFNDEMKCAIMEDCKNYDVMRAQMMTFTTFDNFGRDIAVLLARLHFFTSDFYLNGAEKKALVKQYTNPELCEITERLVFTEPFTNCLNRNFVPQELEELVKSEIYECEEVKKCAAKLKYNFLTSAQALLHGDLHTGSIFINSNNFKVFDSEFAFVGPCSYDIGCIIGNLFFAFAAASATTGHKIFTNWAIATMADILKMYKKTFIELINAHTSDTLLVDKLFCEKHIDSVIKDSVATAGVEILRRTITAFKVSDITQLPTKAKNVSAQRTCIVAGKEMLVNAEKYASNFTLIQNFNNS